MARGWSHLSIRKIVVIAVLAIIAPSLVLTLVGLKLTVDLKRQLERSLADQYAAAARAKVREVEATVAAAEKRVRLRAEQLANDEITAALDAARREVPLVEEIFLLDERKLLRRRIPLAQRGALLYPPRQVAQAAGSETMLWTEPFPPASRRYPRPQTATEAEAMLRELREYRERTVSPTARIRASQVIAATLFRLAQYSEAIKEYRRMLVVDNVGVFSPSLALLARYQIAAAEARRGRTDAGLEAYLELYSDLVHGRTRVGDRDRVEFFKEKIREDVEMELARPHVAQPLARRYRALLAEERELAKRERFLAYLERFVLPRLELQAPSLRTDEEEFRHLWDDEFGEEPYVVAYCAVRGADGSRRVLGLKLDMEAVRREVFAPALATSRFGPWVAFSVVDRRERTVFGRAAEGFAAAEPFPSIFKHWRLAVLELKPAELRQLASYNVAMFSVVNGLMIVAIMVGVGITLKGTARELELSQLKSDFVSNVSHELKTPLALIRMFAETLEMGRVRSEEKVREYYSIITRESERLSQLIDNVLDFSRIESGRKTYEMRPEDLTEVVRDTLRAYSYELAKQGFEVETDIPQRLPPTLMDRNAISLAVLNLLSNAVKYSAGDKRIRVACGMENGAVFVQVTDHGLGIEPGDVEKIFEKFYRARDEVVRSRRGSGLGLAIVKHSIEAHRGTIEVASQKGKGSTFTIRLPVRKALGDAKNPDR